MGLKRSNHPRIAHYTTGYRSTPITCLHLGSSTEAAMKYRDEEARKAACSRRFAAIWRRPPPPPVPEGTMSAAEENFPQTQEPIGEPGAIYPDRLMGADPLNAHGLYWHAVY
ncbi:hypothetical protein OIU85_022759 [Salix viminalis]|uniref:Uncharacterized protein n=1 Tax=Salix viminalis TaxID=40686 RepID=A0A9Q0Z882_SALVM|nr:hypothetical protein OIU85_022759 [Salix viminalis]